jgi:NADH-quinone oxidoreductase subunit L
MTVPLLVLSLFAAFCAWGGEEGPLFRMLLASEPAGVAEGLEATAPAGIALPSHAAVHAKHASAGAFALVVAALGAATAYLFYGARMLNPGDVRRQFPSLYTFLVEKWRFDELYDVMFVRPVHVVSGWFAAFDRVVIDGLLHALARFAVLVAHWDKVFDERIIDGLVNWMADVTYSGGRSLRGLQTGQLRQYIMFIIVGVVGIWVLVQIFAT